MKLYILAEIYANDDYVFDLKDNPFKIYDDVIPTVHHTLSGAKECSNRGDYIIEVEVSKVSKVSKVCTTKTLKEVK